MLEASGGLICGMYAARQLLSLRPYVSGWGLFGSNSVEACGLQRNMTVVRALQD